MGKCQVKTAYGNTVNAYNLERTVCDIINNRSTIDIETANKAIKKCIKSENFSANKMFEYAKKNEGIRQSKKLYGGDYMIKNAKSLMDRANNLAQRCDITTNEILQNYMFERVLERLSKSKYKNNFILKGGLLLSSIMGIDTRTTMDMDTCIKGINLDDTQLYEVLNEILSIDVNDNIKFYIKNSKPIREDDDYGGLKYNLLAQYENLRVNLSIDIATGDLITPKELIEYDYKMMFEDRSLQIMTYNIETIIAEKFQTVISRGILNSRMKDYYDLYYLTTYKQYSKDILRQAIKKYI